MFKVGELLFTPCSTGQLPLLQKLLLVAFGCWWEAEAALAGRLCASRHGTPP